LATVEFWAAKACGSWFTRSSTRVTPATSMSSPVTWVTGLVVTRLVCGMREPVTMTSSRSCDAPASCAMAGAAKARAATPPMIVVDSRKVRLVVAFIYSPGNVI